MSKRTYLPMLRIVAQAVCDYINHNIDRIKRNLPTEYHNRVDQANQACNLLIAVLDTVIPSGG